MNVFVSIKITKRKINTFPINSYLLNKFVIITTIITIDDTNTKKAMK